MSRFWLLLGLVTVLVACSDGYSSSTPSSPDTNSANSASSRILVDDSSDSPINESHDELPTGLDYTSFVRLRKFGTYKFKSQSLAFSPDGKHVATGGKMEFIHVREVTSRSIVLTISGVAKGVEYLSYSPDGEFLAAANGKQVKLWSASSGKHLRDIGSYESDISGVAISPDSSRLAISAGYYDKVDIWDVSKGELISSLKVGSDGPGGLQFSADGTRLYVGGSGGKLSFWNVETGQNELVIEGEDGVLREGDPVVDAHGDVITSIARSPDGLSFATASWDKKVRLWDAKTGSELMTFDGHTDWVLDVAFSPDGNTLVSCCNKGTTRLWDVATGNQVKVFVSGRGYNTEAVAFSPVGTVFGMVEDGSLVLCGSDPGLEQKKWQAHTEGVYSVAFNQEGTRLASVGGENLLRIWEMESGELYRSHELSTEYRVSMCLSADGKRVVIGGATVSALDLDTGKEVWNSEHGYSTHTSVEFGQEESAVYTGSSKAVRVLDAINGEPLRLLEFKEEENYFSAFSPDRMSVVLAGRESSFQILDTNEFSRIQKVETDGTASSFTFSPDGLTLAGIVSDEDWAKSLVLWNVDTGSQLFEINLTDPAGRLLFTPDGRYLLQSSGVIRDSATGEVAGQFEGHADGILSMAFSRDGTLLATGSNDGEIRIWNFSELVD